MKTHLQRLRQSAGFTFNELLVAMSICGIGVLGYAATTASVIGGNRDSSNYTVAINLAQDTMERLKAQTNLQNENRCPAGEVGLSATGERGGVFSRCWKIEDSPIGENLKRIEVTVGWEIGTARSVTLTALVYKN